MDATTFLKSFLKKNLPTKSWKKHSQKLLRKTQTHFYSLTAWAAQTENIHVPKCDQLYIELGAKWLQDNNMHNKKDNKLLAYEAGCSCLQPKDAWKFDQQNDITVFFHLKSYYDLTLPADLFGGVPVLWRKWPLASSLLQAIKTCRQACPPNYLLHF